MKVPKPGDPCVWITGNVIEEKEEEIRCIWHHFGTFSYIQPVESNEGTRYLVLTNTENICVRCDNGQQVQVPIGALDFRE